MNLEKQAESLKNTSWYLVLGAPLALIFLISIVILTYITFRNNVLLTPEEKLIQNKNLCLEEARISYEKCMNRVLSRSSKCETLYKSLKKEC